MKKKLAVLLGCMTMLLVIAGCGSGKFDGVAAPVNSEQYTEVLMQVGDEEKPLDAVLTMPKVAGKP